MTFFRVGLFVISAIFAGIPAAVADFPRYDHIFIIIAENKNYDQIIGSPNAPRLNALAAEYGLATNFYGEVHPSEANYIAMLGGDTFGIHDDDAWYCVPVSLDRYCLHSFIPGYVSHSISSRSLMDQLAEANLSWKGYFEDLPELGSTAIYWPNESNPDPIRPMQLYAAKHNGFINFERVRNDPKITDKIVPLEQLRADIKADTLPNYAHIVLNQCNDMHGLWTVSPPPCLRPGALLRAMAETLTLRSFGVAMPPLPQSSTRLGLLLPGLGPVTRLLSSPGTRIVERRQSRRAAAGSIPPARQILAAAISPPSS